MKAADARRRERHECDIVDCWELCMGEAADEARVEAREAFLALADRGEEA